MAQNRDADDIFDPEDTCPNTELDAEVVTAVGCSQAQDTDLDLIPKGP